MGDGRWGEKKDLGEKMKKGQEKRGAITFKKKCGKVLKMHLFGLSTQNKFAGRSSTATLFAGEKNMDLKGGGGDDHNAQYILLEYC